jgi:hypothetical protein
MMTTLIEIEPGRFVVDRPSGPVARSDLPCPMVISDEMPATEQVDGNFYTSKAAFRAVGRSLGLTEVGTEKFKPRERWRDNRNEDRKRRETIKKAAEIYRAL